MNPGMYPLIDPQAQALRKLAGQVRSGFNTGGATYTSALGAAGLDPSGATTLALSAATRTRALAVNGRGAVRFALINNGSGSASNVQIEVFVDGVKAIDTGSRALTSGSHMPFVGGVGSTNVVAALDFIPFDSSLEIWVTASVSGNYQHGFLIDLHQ